MSGDDDAGYLSDGFEDGNELLEDELEVLDSQFVTDKDMMREFDAVDACVSRRFQVDKASLAWHDINRIRDVRFNFSHFFECLHLCYRDMLFGAVTTSLSSCNSWTTSSIP